jgi:hypothetical protein
MLQEDFTSAKKLLGKQSLSSDEAGGLKVDSQSPFLNNEGLSYCQSYRIGASHNDTGAFLQNWASDGLVEGLPQVIPWSSGLKVAGETSAQSGGCEPNVVHIRKKSTTLFIARKIIDYIGLLERSSSFTRVIVHEKIPNFHVSIDQQFNFFVI